MSAFGSRTWSGSRPPVPSRSPAPTPRIIRNIVKTAHIVGPWVNTHFTLICAAILGLVVIFALGKSSASWARRRLLMRSAKSRVAARRIGTRIGWKDAERFIKWPRHPEHSGAVVVVRYPPTFSALDREIAFIPEVLTSLVGGDWQPEHDHLHNRLRFVRSAPPKQLPTYLEYPDDQARGIDRIPVAVDAEGEWIEADLTSESPHILIAGKTRTGKTSTLTIPIAHIASRGGLVDVLDPKLVGYKDSFSGLGNVRVHTSIPDMVRAVEQFYEDMRARYSQMEAGSYTGGPTRLLVIDEMGTFMSMVKTSWAASRGQGDPTEAPTITQYRLLLWQGGQADFHLVVGAQQANAGVMAGTDNRESFALRIGTGTPSKRGGPLLFGTDDLPAVDPKVKGRGAVCLEGGDVVPVQLAFLPAERARTIARRGQNTFTTEDQVAAEIPTTVETEPPKTLDHDVRDASVATIPQVNLVKQVPARAELEPPRLGRPPIAPASPVMMTCKRCAHTWVTRIRDGAAGPKCAKCGLGQRVPVGLRKAQALEVER